MVKQVVFFALLAQIVVISGCDSSCPERYVNSVRKMPLYTTVRAALRDTLTAWIGRNIRLVQHYRQDKWEIDSLILFNDEYSRCLAVVISQGAVGDHFDNAKFIAGELARGKWVFYFASMPIIGISRQDDMKPASMRDISDMVHDDLVRGGAFAGFECKANAAYINDWFDHYLLLEHHRKFLVDTLRY